jgi:hypothetical protein
MTKRPIVQSSLFILIVGLLVTQTRYLILSPVPDSAMWWGDESWRMLQMRDLLLAGKPLIREALGSTLSLNTGLITCSNWLSGLIYGIPLLVWGASTNLIFIGRMVSLCFGLATLLSLYTLLRKAYISKTYALFTLILFVASRAFFYGSHSARSDMVTALGITIFLYVSLRILQREKPLQAYQYLFYGLLWASGPQLYLHVLSLTAIPFIYTLWVKRFWRSKSALVTLLFGVCIGVAIMILPYWLLTGSLSLFGGTGKAIQYNSVVNEIPIFRLFSPSVQYHNLVGRLWQWTSVAAPLMIVGVISWLVFMVRRRTITSHLSSTARHSIILSILVLASAFLFQGTAVFYAVHILPALALLCAIGIERLSTAGNRPRVYQIGIVSIAIVVSLISYWRTTAVARSDEFVTKKVWHSSIALSYQASKIFELRGPRILVDQGTTSALLRESTNGKISIMTHHFLYFPIDDSPIDSLLARNSVDFLLLDSRQTELLNYARSHDSLVQAAVGVLHETNASLEDIEAGKVPQDTMFLFQRRTSTQ